MRWTHRYASSQSERSRGRPEAAAQTQRGPGIGGSDLPPCSRCVWMNDDVVGVTFDIRALFLRTRMGTAPFTTQRLVMRAPSSRCCRGVEQT